MVLDHPNMVNPTKNIDQNKTLTRNSSIGSSRIYYYQQSKEGVPFKWEMQPGMAKDPPQQETIPPICPSPAMLSSKLPKPCIDHIQQPRPSIHLLSKLKFFKQIMHFKKKQKEEGVVHQKPSSRSEKSMEFESCNFEDGEFMDDVYSSPNNDSSFTGSSSSFSSSANERISMESVGENVERDSGRGLPGCSPWNFSLGPVLIRVAKRDK